MNIINCSNENIRMILKSQRSDTEKNNLIENSKRIVIDKIVKHNLKSQIGSELLSSLGLKTPLIEIRLLVDILFWMQSHWVQFQWMIFKIKWIK